VRRPPTSRTSRASATARWAASMLLWDSATSSSTPTIRSIPTRTKTRSRMRTKTTRFEWRPRIEGDLPSVSGSDPTGGAGPGRQHGLVERRVALHEHRQPDLVQDGHDPGAGLADSEAAAGPVQPQVVGQQDADRLAGEVGDILQVDHDPAG